MGVLKTLILFLLLGVVAYEFVHFFPIFFPPAPCSQPIPYTLGTFDTQFGISKDYFLSALSDAENIWEKSYGEQLFSYETADSASDVLKINLIYDYRQQATSELDSLGITVNDDKASYDSLKTKFTALKAQYDSAKTSFGTEVEAFNQKQKTYEDKVKYWNDKGGAPQNEYNKLQAEKSALDEQSKQLDGEQTNINNMVSEINALVVVINRLATTLNLSVEQYNTINGGRGESFEEGVYTSDGSTKGMRQINIYEFSNREKLVRVLAHELGHALGLEHVDDPKAIMYKLNQGNNEIPTEADLSELNTLCKSK